MLQSSMSANIKYRIATRHADIPKFEVSHYCNELCKSHLHLGCKRCDSLPAALWWTSAKCRENPETAPPQKKQS